MKFTKGTSLFLAFLILVSNVGLAFNVHYCGGNIAGISSVYPVDASDVVKEMPSEKSCCAPKATTSKSCCKDKIVKIDKKSEVTVKVFSFQIDAPFVFENWKPIVFTSVPTVQNSPIPTYYCDANAPPLYKLYSQYTFYA
ncbi:hypothetical protein FNO01nite_01320 [Flavobacterium noncentrifugens]|uniref:Uncharacterized protein n=1 Tax=Flavobacterium noncentrifugens TaxID=1128970 RepID=A0A1G8RJG3_9FLAO|nr:hypothetical protein [Flavobacterium noncentrifugens]GEP49460.1 hypothetical protein FNO01nite_01320 [Flavobacterium noncentrifugens]SDJ17079.1 hypothetical protein SAMN04487935_0150 [Flavobacterium noncentrifugens]